MPQLITVDQLVNIERSKKSSWPYSKEHIDEALRQANAKRPKEITDFVDALSRMFGRIGMHGVCRLCFKGVLMDYRKPGLGCCGSCLLLLEDRCANKPIGCARYMCDFTSTLFPRTWKFVREISTKTFGTKGLPDGSYGYFGGCYGGATEAESRLKLTEADKRRLRWAIRKLDKWSEKEAA